MTKTLKILSLLVILSGCVSQVNRPTPESVEQTTLRIAAWGDVWDQQDLDECITAFMNEYTEITVKLDMSPLPVSSGTLSGFIDGYEHRIQAELATRNAPDVMMFPLTRLINYASRGAFLPLDHYLDDVDTRGWPGGSVFDGTRYGVPHPVGMRSWAIYAQTDYPYESFALLVYVVNYFSSKAGLGPLVVEGAKEWPDDGVFIADAMLERQIRESLGTTTSSWGPISKDDLLHITNLKAYGVESLEGIEALLSLKELDLTNSRVQDIRPLVHLPNLEWLSLEGNRVLDFRPLAELQQLKYLNLSRVNRFVGFDSGGRSTHVYPTDFLPLGQLTELETLIIRQANISDVSSLVGFPNLLYLDLSNNSIDDFSDLQYLPTLRSLNLSGNIIHDLNFLRGCLFPSWIEIILTGNPLKDISGLLEMGDISSLRLSGSEILKESPSTEVIGSLRSRGWEVRVWQDVLR